MKKVSHFFFLKTLILVNINIFKREQKEKLKFDLIDI